MPSNFTGWVVAGVGFTLGVAAANLILGIVRTKAV